MSCVTCDGAEKIAPPAGSEWLLTGSDSMPCPVCQGPHLQWFLRKMVEEDQILICSNDDCEQEIETGWLVYAQLKSSRLPELDEAILLCCDDHAASEHEGLIAEDHPTVKLPFCIQDVREAREA